MSKRYPGGIIRKTPPTPSQSSAQGIWDMASVTQAVKENNWPIAGVPDPVSRSLRFRRSASAYLNRTFNTPTNGTKWTISYWAKLGIIGRANHFAPNLSTNEGSISIESDFALYVNPRVGTPGGAGTNYFLGTTQVFRDPSAWYHIVVALDTTQATASNRVKVYVNGTQVTAFSTANYPPQNSTPIMGSAVSHAIGRVGESGYEFYYDGLFGEFYFVDGQALTPSSFGNTNDQTGVWQPIAYTGTYGTNGFYLPFSNVTSTTTIGNDFSGNNNNWTANNFSLSTGTSIQSFTTTGTTSWTAPTGVTSVNYLVVAGGGGGAYAGGGGAGGMRTGTIPVVPGVSYTVTVGAGGTGGTGFADNALKGSDSVFGSITSIGGGAGNLSYASLSAKNSGGSGGAGGIGTTSGGSGTAGQGNAGGAGDASNAGGGGGAGAAGGNASGGFSGNGGAGLSSSISGTSVTYAGGGGGGCSSNSNTNFGSGGAGGGGSSSTLNGSAGTANTGGGGGGASYNGSSFGNGGAGGSGIVILSWASGATSTYDSMVDVPTQWIPYNTTGDVGALWRGNYCVMNPLDAQGTATLTDANLTLASSSTTHRNRKATFVVPSTGKWYWELTTASTCSSSVILGWGLQTTAAATDSQAGNANTWMAQNDANQDIWNQTTNVLSTGSAVAGGSIRQVAYDADSGKLWFGVNNIWYSSTDLTSGNPSAGTNQCMTLSAGSYFPTITCYNLTANVNFGQRPFVYTPPVGFKTLNTTNLPTPTIGATASTQANRYFDIALWTGDAVSPKTVYSNLQFQPDMTWAKTRSVSTQHALYDAVRGAGSGKILIPNTTDPEGGTAGSTSDAQYGYLSSFNSNGISTVTGSSGINYFFNASGVTYVGWNWRASNATAVTNTAGSITSTVSANTTAGFSIATWTGQTSGSATIGHGLGVAPSVVLVKGRNDAGQWWMYHSAMGNTQYIWLNNTGGSQTGSGTNAFANTAPTSTVFTVGTSFASSSPIVNWVAYCFAPVAGYSAFGSYTGNGSSDGTFVYTGFRPRYVMVKRTDSANAWVIYDTARDTSNVEDLILLANDSGAEVTTSNTMDIISNGFKLRSSEGATNGSGGTYIYMAFAESPFKYALAR